MKTEKKVFTMDTAIGLRTQMGCGIFEVEIGVWVVIMGDENPRAESEMQCFLTSDSNAAFSEFSPRSPAYCIVDVSQQSLVAEMVNPCSIRCCNLKIKMGKENWDEDGLARVCPFLTWT